MTVIGTLVAWGGPTTTRSRSEKNRLQLYIYMQIHIDQGSAASDDLIDSRLTSAYRLIDCILLGVKKPKKTVCCNECIQIATHFRTFTTISQPSILKRIGVPVLVRET